MPPGERPHAAPAESSNELIEVYEQTAQSVSGRQCCAHCGKPINPRNYIEQGDRVYHPACAEARRRIESLDRDRRVEPVCGVHAVSEKVILRQPVRAFDRAIPTGT